MNRLEYSATVEIVFSSNKTGDDNKSVESTSKSSLKVDANEKGKSVKSARKGYIIKENETLLHILNNLLKKEVSYLHYPLGRQRGMYLLQEESPEDWIFQS